MRELLILGAGGQGKVVAEIATLMNKWQNISFLDDYNSTCLGFKVIGKFSDLPKLLNQYQELFVAIGDNQVRMFLLKQIHSMHKEIPVLIHPSAVVSDYSSIGEGSIVMANATINPNCKIGKGCIINTATSIDHDCVIEDYVHISPGCHLSGKVKVGKCAWLGTGTCVKDTIQIGEDSVCGLGSVIISDIPPNIIVVGNPAAQIERKV